MKNKFFCSFLFLIMIFFNLCFKGHTVKNDISIKVFKNKEVKGDFFTLGEIAEILCEDSYLKKELNDILISKSPQPKDKKNYSL